MTKTYKVVGIGNAIVDVLAKCDDAFLTENGVEKGIMQLIDTERAAELYGAMAAGTEISGGSAANTISGLSTLDVKAAFVGKVKDDQLGRVFAHDIRAQGSDFDTPMVDASHADETGRSMILVTPDGERSMNTYLGVANQLSVSDIDPDLMANTEWLYLEGYLFDRPESQAAFVRAVELCNAAGGRSSISLSDPFCVDRHREAFRDLIANHIDMLFCNEHEISAMYSGETLQDSITNGAQYVDTLVCTAGADGAYIGHGGKIIHVPTEHVDLVDATGAGDLFAAGFLAGMAQGKPLDICGRMGCLAAGEVISHMGARPDADLLELFASKGL
jgi:sugar/nucleoside kinase (ribokinase family)